ncbi:hypothetical protein BGX23_011571 [Mortierella sp. AD031]|nr:hypothetical protein BGX23_011571 [Mortierella sp. AD031]
MRQSHKSAIVALTVACTVSLFTFALTSAASPVGTLKTQQSSFHGPSVELELCGTVIGIDFGDEEFSVGLMDLEGQLELIPNEHGRNHTASFVRVTEFPDGTREVLIGPDAVTRPMDERSVELKRLRGAEVKRWYEKYGHERNSSVPVPDHMFQFEPNMAYGLGQHESIEAGSLFGTGRRMPRQPYLFTDNDFIIIGEEWEETTPRRSFGNHNMTSQCERTPAEMDWFNERKKKVFERRQTVATLLMGRAKEMAETRLSEKVKHAVITTASFMAKTHPQPETNVDAAIRAGLQPVRILDQSEAAVLAYEPLISQAELAEHGRPQTIVMYYLNTLTEGISVFESYRVKSEQFLRLKTVAKYHFYQSIPRRLHRALAERLFDKYSQGQYFTSDEPTRDYMEIPEATTHPLDKNDALSYLNAEINHHGNRQARYWERSSGDTQERFYVSNYDYVLFSRREWWDFERAFLKTHFTRMLDRAYVKSDVKAEQRPAKIDHFLIVDESQYRKTSTSIMQEVLGGGAKELSDPAIEPKFAVAHGVARLAEYLTKNYSRESCK